MTHCPRCSSPVTPGIPDCPVCGMPVHHRGVWLTIPLNPQPEPALPLQERVSRLEALVAEQQFQMGVLKAAGKTRWSLGVERGKLTERRPNA